MMSYTLSGRTILLTRPYQASVLDKQLIENHGGNALIVPLIDTTYVENEKEAEILSSLESYSWIVFTSRNAAVHTINVLEKMNLVSSLRKLTIAAIGKKTSNYIEEKGFQVSFTPQSFRADDFIKEFPFHKLSSGKRVLFPQGNLARNVVMNEFKQHGIICEDWVLYNTIKPSGSTEKLIKVLQNEKTDVITFASPSAVAYFVESVSKFPHLLQLAKSGEWTFASIGPTTTEELRSFNIPVHIEPQNYTMPDMIEQIACFFQD